MDESRSGGPGGSVIPAQWLSEALTALGAYAEPPLAGQLAATEATLGTEALTARLANALYGSALGHVMTSEIAASQAGVRESYRHETWQAVGADNEGIAGLLHYTALRLKSELGAIRDALPIDLGIGAASAAAAEALALLCEVMTIRSMTDPRAEHLTETVGRAAEQLEAGGQQLRDLFAAGRGAAQFIIGPEQ